MKNLIQTNEKTFNKNIKKEVLILMPNAKSFKKSQVSGVGYVYFIKDEKKTIIGKVLKETSKGMKIYIN